MKININSLVNQLIWGGQLNFDNQFKLHIGNKIPREVIYNYENFTMDENLFRGEYILNIHCAWRIIKNEILASSNDEYEMVLPIFNLIKNKKITNIELSKFNDFCLILENGMELQLIKDRTNEINFSVIFDDLIYSVYGNESILKEYR